MAWTKAVQGEIDRNSADVDFLKDIADQDWLPEPVELLALGRGLRDNAIDLRNRLAGPDEHHRAHLGEAESIVYASHLMASGQEATILAEDRDAIAQARFRGLRPLQTTDILAEMKAMGDASADELWGIYTSLVSLHRLPPGLKRNDLFA